MRVCRASASRFHPISSSPDYELLAIICAAMCAEARQKLLNRVFGLACTGMSQLMEWPDLRHRTALAEGGPLLNLIAPTETPVTPPSVLEAPSDDPWPRVRSIIIQLSEL